MFKSYRVFFLENVYLDNRKRQFFFIQQKNVEVVREVNKQWSKILEEQEWREEEYGVSSGGRDRLGKTILFWRLRLRIQRQIYILISMLGWVEVGWFGEDLGRIYLWLLIVKVRRFFLVMFSFYDWVQQLGSCGSVGALVV